LGEPEGDVRPLERPEGQAVTSTTFLDDNARPLKQHEWDEHVGKEHKFDPTCANLPVVNRGQEAGAVSR
jgi:hypothetical protein